MAQTEETERLSLSWDSYQKIICNGLSQLQQRGEFVDMTLAADGHHVKVHQMVLSLVSPYIKDLISTAQSAHPIIFLHNISYNTLCAILEYIYTGEVHMPKNHLPDLINAGKALHIRGLREIDENQTAYSEPTTSCSPPRTKSISERLRALKEKKIAAQPKEEKKTTPPPPPPVPVPMSKIYVETDVYETDDDLAMDIQEATVDIQDSTDSTLDIQDSPADIQDESTAVGETKLDTTGTPNNSNNWLGESIVSLSSKEATKNLLRSKVHYTVSNQGGLQTIHNRYMYQLRYISKDRRISWRCINYNKTRCSATIFTNANDQVTDLTCRHNHPFHDKNILRKVGVGIVYSKFHDASIKSELNQKVQYTMSNQGGLQVIHNRFIYHLRYFGKKNRKRLWRCVDYSSSLKCPANICTNENNQVTERTFTHNHGFHDEKILKKVQFGMIYSIFQEAENKADGKKKNRCVPCSVIVQSRDATGSKHIV